MGSFPEPIYLRVYRDVPVLTVSPSTRDDLRKLGFRAPITVIPQGIEAVESRSTAERAEACFLYVGRLAPSKRVDHMIRALAQFRRSTGKGTLWLAGNGSIR